MNDDAARLQELSARIERLAVTPAEVRRREPWLLVTSPFFRLVGWRPRIRTVALRALLAALRATEHDAAARPALVPALDAAMAELSENVTTAERATVLHGALAHASLAGWLTRLHEVTTRAARAARDPENDARRRVAIALDAEWALTSLAVRADSTSVAAAPARDRDAPAGVTEREGGAGAAPGATPEDDQSGSLDETTAAERARLVEVELAAIDRILDAAHAETHFLGRRRRLFEAARKLLLDASAALPLDPDAVHARTRHIADEIVLANRWQAAGVAPDVALPHQAVSALARGERQKLYATLRASFSIASGEGDVELVARAGEVLRRLDAGASGEPPGDESITRSAHELLGEAAVGAVRSAYDSARKELEFEKTRPAAPDLDEAEREQRAALWDRYLDPGAMLATLSAAVSVDGQFEVGGTLAPVRVFEETRRVRVVSFPTQDMVFVPSRDIRDLPSAVIEDPRGVMLALAEGRLLARKFLKVETERTPRTRMVSEVRVYILDGSDSMLLGGSGRHAGARARMRDAILLAEIATLHRRATSRGQAVRVVLFYRYFTKRLGNVVRVASAADALRAMADVVGTPRHGGTDIEAALVASFDQIRDARASDPDLARAQIVLVTDGDASVDEAAVRAARERAGDLPIGVSVIALGEENPVLRRLVARQRARGEPAFYHFVPDADLQATAQGQGTAAAPVHGTAAPAAPSATLSERVTALSAELGTLVDEIDALDRARTAPTTRAPDAMGTPDAAALASLGLHEHPETEGARAHREARARDERALASRFDAWFPSATPAAEPVPSHHPTAAISPPDRLHAASSLDPLPPADAPSPDAGALAPTAADDRARAVDRAWTADVDAALVVLATLADVLVDLGGTPAERRADAIELLERLLPDAQLSPARYRAVLRARPAPIVAALAAVRASVAAFPAASPASA